MTFDYNDYGNFDLGAEASVPLVVDENGQFSLIEPANIQTSVLKEAVISAFEPYKLERLGDSHFSTPEDFVPKTARARMDETLPPNFNPHTTIWGLNNNK